MKIRKLEICGFKSFVDRTVLRFDQDVTGIVGPNGCGKSNVVDAVKWAMGEQSAQRLRGRAMEDVIFNGSEARGPHGFAEVSVTFDNTDGLTPPEYRDYAEITITRRLDRSGHSDYLINKTPVRLMDVTNLFLGTGVGRRAYSIIEQGRIGYIVSSKAEDRRLMIEEAAGITKFKSRKKSAERKMDQTRQNLLRVTDIIQEIERSLASLKRQAQKAERYKAYRGELRDLELHVASHRYLELAAHARMVSDRRVVAEAEAAGVRAAQVVRDAEVEADRVEVSRAESTVEQAQNRSYALDNAVRALEGELETQRERLAGYVEKDAVAGRELTALEERRGALEAERAHLVAALASLEEAERSEAETLARADDELERRKGSAADAEKVVATARARLGEADTRIARAEAVQASIARRREDARQRLDRLRAERGETEQRQVEVAQSRVALDARRRTLESGKQATGERRAELEGEVARLGEAVRVLDEETAVVREELAERRSRLRSLESLHRRLEGVGAGVRRLLGAGGGQEGSASAPVDGLVGLVADRIACPAECTAALASALGDQLQGVVVASRVAALDALEALRQGDGGRATLMPRRPRRVVGVDEGDLPRARALGLRRLVDQVSYEPDDAELVHHLLAGWWLAPDLAAALEAQDAGIGPVVTGEGDVLDLDGRITGGSGDDVNAHLLELQREIRELREVVAGLDGTTRERQERLGVLKTDLARAQGGLDAARTDAHDAEIALVTVDKDLRSAEEDAERLAARLDALTGEVGEVEQALALAETESQEAAAEIEQARASKAEAEGELAAASSVHAERRASVDAQATEVTELKVRAAQARERVERDRQARDRIDRDLVELSTRRTQLEADIEEGAAQQGALAARMLGNRERLVDAVAEAMAAEEALAGHRARFDELRAALSERELGLRELRTTLEGMTGRLSELALEEREVTLAIDHLIDSMVDRHRVVLPKVLGDYHARELPDAAIEARIDELIRLIDRMGEINLTAIDEYQETSKRYDYLVAQRADLEEALSQLDRAIRQMNRESRRLFKETFEAVDERFRQMFPRLFGGGKAELRMTDPDDLLETGVEIIAQPPGKKLGSLELMSGGEKALTAVSLLLSIFQYKPSPFCVLDEVDAPLDEANIGRFAQAVREMTDHSQFIVITHAKRTMEFTDLLYGVTMEQPGISKIVSVELRGGPGRVTPVDGATGQQVAVA
jgi:chromosome segregation protein